MEKILKFIDENYQGKISKDDIEDLTAYSHRNSQRLFKRFFNETISNFQKRLRLENAFKNLIYTSESIKNIAYDVGYENQASFNKAFLKHFNTTPSEARKNKKLIFSDFFHQSPSFKEKIKFEEVRIPEKEVHYKIIITNNYNNSVINELWDIIESESKNQDDKNYYGLILDQPLISTKIKCRYEACIDDPPGTNGFLKKKIFGRKYLKFTHLKEFDLIEETYCQIFYNWMFHLTYEIDHSPIIEHYIKDENLKNKDGYRTDIYIPIR